MSIDAITVAIDPGDALVTAVHAAGDQQIAAARRLAAERDIALRQVAAYERRIAELEHECRELRKANESWQALARRSAPTVEIPRVAAEPVPRRRRHRGRHQ